MGICAYIYVNRRRARNSLPAASCATSLQKAVRTGEGYLQEFNSRTSSRRESGSPAPAGIDPRYCSLIPPGSVNEYGQRCCVAAQPRYSPANRGSDRRQRAFDFWARRRMSSALYICSSINMFIYCLMQLLASIFQPRALSCLDRQAGVYWIDPAVSGSQVRMQDPAVRGQRTITRP